MVPPDTAEEVKNLSSGAIPVTGPEVVFDLLGLNETGEEYVVIAVAEDALGNLGTPTLFTFQTPDITDDLLPLNQLRADDVAGAREILERPDFGFIYWEDYASLTDGEKDQIAQAVLDWRGQLDPPEYTSYYAVADIFAATLNSIIDG